MLHRWGIKETCKCYSTTSFPAPPETHEIALRPAEDAWEMETGTSHALIGAEFKPRNIGMGWDSIFMLTVCNDDVLFSLLAFSSLMEKDLQCSLLTGTFSGKRYNSACSGQQSTSRPVARNQVSPSGPFPLRKVYSSPVFQRAQSEGCPLLFAPLCLSGSV